MIRQKILLFCLAVILGGTASVGHANMNSTATKALAPGTLAKKMAFDRITLGELYPGIRVSLKAAGNNVEKLLYVAPGAAPDAIKMDVDGVQSISINAHRQLP